VSGGWQAFELVPDDVLFFRDGRPSTRGADHYLRSLFPPHPSTLYGAVRTRRLLDEGIELAGLNERSWKSRLGGLTDELGDWGKLGSLRLRGPWLVRDGVPLFPAPQDLGLEIQPPGAKEEPGAPRIAAVVRYRPEEESGKAAWSHPLRPMAPCEPDGDGWRRWRGDPGTEPSPVPGWFLKPAGLAAWRRGGVPEAEDFVHAGELWCDETRTGVGLEAGQRMSAKSLLYTFGFIRLRSGVSLGFEVAGSGLRAGGRLRLGGEGRTAMLQAGPPFPNGEPVGAKRISLCFATPALSAAGGYPPGFSAGRLSGEIAGRTWRLTAAALRGFVNVGGWDLARDRAKPLRRAVPPGSVFLLESQGGEHAPSDALDGLCLSDVVDNPPAWQGFGLAVAGVSL
jgi:CRISPR-associated protein Cmr3